MNKLLIAVALCAALTACKKEEAAPAADAAAPAASAPAADATAAPAADAPAAPAEEAASASSLPADCEAYLTRVQACVDKAGSNPASDAVKQGLETTRQQWAGISNQDALASACKMANDQFAATAASLKCE